MLGVSKVNREHGVFRGLSTGGIPQHTPSGSIRMVKQLYSKSDTVSDMKVGMVAYSYYENDNRIRKWAEILFRKYLGRQHIGRWT
jgi:hypothetical protein